MSVDSIATQLTEIDCQIDQAVFLPWKQAGKQAVEIHGKLQRLKLELDQCDRSDPGYEQIRQHMISTTRRLMRDLFKMEDE